MNPAEEYARLASVEDFDPDRAYDIERDGRLLDLIATKMLWDQRREEEEFGTDLERDILCYLGEVGEANTREIANALSRERETVSSALRAMRATGDVEQVGTEEVGGQAANVWAPITTAEPSGPAWLTPVQMIHRHRHEVQTEAGTPDPSIAEGIYHRPYREPRRPDLRPELD